MLRCQSLSDLFNMALKRPSPTSCSYSIVFFFFPSFFMYTVALCKGCLHERTRMIFILVNSRSTPVMKEILRLSKCGNWYSIRLELTALFMRFVWYGSNKFLLARHFRSLYMTSMKSVLMHVTFGSINVKDSCYLGKGGTRPFFLDNLIDLGN